MSSLRYNPADVPDTHWMVDPEWATVTHSYHFKCRADLIHDNLLDLSHLGYVHLRTIGGNASVHMNAQMRVESDDTSVRVIRHMPGSQPPPTYLAAYPFRDKVDRWQEISCAPAFFL